jgi:hypothetical protein
MADATKPEGTAQKSQSTPEISTDLENPPVLSSCRGAVAENGRRDRVQSQENAMFRSAGKSSQFAVLTVELLEERCALAAVGAIQPPLLEVHVGFVPLIPTQDATLKVRTDLFGGGHGLANESAEDPLAPREAFAPVLNPSPAVDAAGPTKSDHPPVADEVGSSAVSYAAEPIALCVVVEYD